MSYTAAKYGEGNVSPALQTTVSLPGTRPCFPSTWKAPGCRRQLALLTEYFSQTEEPVLLGLFTAITLPIWGRMAGTGTSIAQVAVPGSEAGGSPLRL